MRRNELELERLLRSENDVWAEDIRSRAS
jgi:hypothetical protein